MTVLSISEAAQIQNNYSNHVECSRIPLLKEYRVVGEVDKFFDQTLRNALTEHIERERVRRYLLEAESNFFDENNYGSLDRRVFGFLIGRTVLEIELMDGERGVRFELPDNKYLVGIHSVGYSSITGDSSLGTLLAFLLLNEGESITFEEIQGTTGLDRTRISMDVSTLQRKLGQTEYTLSKIVLEDARKKDLLLERKRLLIIGEQK